jgi:hypothetical protein
MKEKHFATLYTNILHNNVDGHALKDRDGGKRQMVEMNGSLLYKRPRFSKDRRVMEKLERMEGE